MRVISNSEKCKCQSFFVLKLLQNCKITPSMKVVRAPKLHFLCPSDRSCFPFVSFLYCETKEGLTFTRGLDLNFLI